MNQDAPEHLSTRIFTLRHATDYARHLYLTSIRVLCLRPTLCAPSTMSFKLSELLNPAPSSRPPSPPERLQPTPPSQQADADNVYAPARKSSYDSYVAVTSTYEAANALTALATSGAPSYSSSYSYDSGLHPSHTEDYSSTPAQDDVGRRQSSYGPLATPLEPSQQHNTIYSPTLEQYHHGSRSRSPEQQRRQSSFSRYTPPPTLAPIASFTEPLNERPSHHSSSFGHDASQIVPHASSSPQNDANDLNQHREADYVRDTPTVSLIRQPSPAVKPEPSNTPQGSAQMAKMKNASNGEGPPKDETLKGERSRTLSGLLCWRLNANTS